MHKNGKGYMSSSNGDNQTNDAVSQHANRTTGKAPH